MSKSQKFIVDIEFSDKVTSDVDIQEIAQNIATAIINEANNGMGIAPSEGDALTEIVRVQGWYSDVQVIEHTN